MSAGFLFGKDVHPLNASLYLSAEKAAHPPAQLNFAPAGTEYPSGEI